MNKMRFFCCTSEIFPIFAASNNEDNINLKQKTDT